MRGLAGGCRVAEPIAVTALGCPRGGVGFLDPAGAREEGNGGSKFRDVGRGYCYHHGGGGLFSSLGWVRLQEPGREDGDAHGVRDREGECREEVLLVGGHVASG